MSPAIDCPAAPPTRRDIPWYSENGLELIERVHAKRPGLPVLVTTGYMNELPGRGKPSGTLDVLHKPYQHQDLPDRVGAALKRAA